MRVLTRIAGVCLVLVSLSSCQGTRKPTETDAKGAVQGFLDQQDPGVWRVDRVEKSNGRDAQIQGTQAYIMEGIVHVTVLKNKDTFNLLAMLGANWLADINGKAGETRQARIEVVWMKTENGWQLVSPRN